MDSGLSYSTSYWYRGSSTGTSTLYASRQMVLNSDNKIRVPTIIYGTGTRVTMKSCLGHLFLQRKKKKHSIVRRDGSWELGSHLFQIGCIIMINQNIKP
jgi:hypothetical protein